MQMHRMSALAPRLDLGPERAGVELDGRRVRVTKVFWSYWYLAAERQAMFMRRVRGEPAPWTADPILGAHRFTNAYRASDRVSQSLLQDVIYSGDYGCRDTVLRVLLFKIFNRTDTWQHLVSQVGEPTVGHIRQRCIHGGLGSSIRFEGTPVLGRLHHALALAGSPPQACKPHRAP